MVINMVTEKHFADIVLLANGFCRILTVTFKYIYSNTSYNYTNTYY